MSWKDHLLKSPQLNSFALQGQQQLFKQIIFTTLCVFGILFNSYQKFDSFSFRTWLNMLKYNKYGRNMNTFYNILIKIHARKIVMVGTYNSQYCLQTTFFKNRIDHKLHVQLTNINQIPSCFKFLIIIIKELQR